MATRPALVPATVATALAVVADAKTLAAWSDEFRAQYRGEGARRALRAFQLGTISPVPVNAILHGPPGTGKTSMSSAWARAISEAFLAVTFSPFTDIAELLGPVDLGALAAGRLERVSSPRRPNIQTARMTLLDELPRGSPAVRAASLSYLSDRVTPMWEACATHLVVAGANTRMTSEDDRALVDRFALRVDVPAPTDPVDVRHVVFRDVPVDGAGPTSAPLPPLPAGLIERMRAHASTVTFSDDIAAAVTKLVTALQLPAPGGASYPVVSPRRWVIATRLLQAAATMAGRASVDWSDLVDVLPLVLDDGPESRTALKNAIDAVIPKWVSAMTQIEAAATRAIDRARRVGEGRNVKQGEGDAHANVNTEFDTLLDTVSTYPAAVRSLAADRLDTARDEVIAAYTAGQDVASRARKAGK